MAPIHWACTRGNTEVVRFLLQRGVLIDSVDEKHTTPLAIAAQYDHTVLVFSLVNSRADINVLDHCQDSALHWAAYKGNQQTVALLHYLGLPADAQDSYGSTPLHLATSQGASSVVEYLLESSEVESLVQIRDAKGRTPMDVAAQRGHKHVLKQLNALNPSALQRTLGIVMGDGGEKALFLFFIADAVGSMIFYLCYLSPVVESMAQDALLVALFVVMMMFHVASYVLEPGRIATEGKPHQLYRQALELAASGRVDEAEEIGSLCHTCRIARPLRSKHCQTLKRCVSVFDHHCPYVHNTLGANNYRPFVIFLFFAAVAITLNLGSCVQYLLARGNRGIVVFELINMTIVGVFAWLMVIYHSTLVVRNLTTNEQMHLIRYPYLRDEVGRFRNAFDRGYCANFEDFWRRGERTAENPYYYTELYATTVKRRDHGVSDGEKSSLLSGENA